MSGKIIGIVHECNPTGNAGPADDLDAGTVWECSCGKRWVVSVYFALPPEFINQRKRKPMVRQTAHTWSSLPADAVVDPIRE